ncbi:A24 family peptidase [Stakelama tenebrarum]|uniref:Peptidase n=1 Tax=Stakelama tenebrarum TaxID=2711215 RepID=A0A6G6Y2W3_9SPHN|nr:prepilin peptidase [Sphingosinithalassobacter tenebrarum]QIG79147.1 peptidase [Sphingosinithalassobacter tenebrarum]
MGAYVCAILLIALALLLVSAGIEDARRREIANWKNAAIALMAPLWWWGAGLSLWPDIAIQIGVAALVFALFVGAFALGQMGGGDVKLIGALALWLPIQPLIWMLILMSLLGGALTLLLVVERYFRRTREALEIPYGIAIALATLIVLREPILNQFV